MTKINSFDGNHSKLHESGCDVDSGVWTWAVILSISPGGMGIMVIEQKLKYLLSKFFMLLMNV
jgi:hypothetical protein